MGLEVDVAADDPLDVGVALDHIAAARIAVFEFIEGWYNPRRRHPAIGYLSPMNFERSQPPPANTLKFPLDSVSRYGAHDALRDDRTEPEDHRQGQVRGRLEKGDRQFLNVVDGVQLPVAHDLNGTQPTTDYRARIEFVYHF